MLAMTWHS